MDRVVPVETAERLLAHTAWLTRVARAITTTSDDADEVVQETWLRALERPPAHGRNLRGWLATLARNLVRSRRRSREREDARVRGLERPESPDGPDDAVARAELQQVVLDAVLALAEPYRSTLVLRFLDELSAEEIAKRRGEPVETVRTRVKRGLEQVRVRVAEKLGGEREQLPALLAPLLSGGGAIVATSAKVGWLVGIAAAVVAVSTTLVATRARHEGGARDVAAVGTAAVTAAAATPDPAISAARTPEETSVPAAAASPLAPTFDVVGTVVDVNGAAVAGASVMLLDREHSKSRSSIGVLSMARWLRGGRTSAFGSAARNATSDEHGNFQIAAVERSQLCSIAAFDPTGGISESIDVDPPNDSKTKSISLRLLGGIRVHGRVVDADGASVVHAKLSIQGSSGGYFGESNEWFSDDQTFSIPPTPVEELTLTAFNEEGTHRSQPVRLLASDGPALREVTLRLDREPCAVSLHGRLLGPDQQPLAASHPFLKRLAEALGRGREAPRVHVWPVAGELPDVGTPKPLLMVGSSSFDAKRGEYTCIAPLFDDDLRPTCLVAELGMRVIAVMPLDEALLEPTDDVHEAPDLVVADFVKPPEATNAVLDVSVVDAATGQLLEGEPTNISILLRLDGVASSMLANQGSSHRQQVIPPSRASIVASSRGYVSDWIDGDFAARAEPYPLTIALRRAVRAVRGTVLDAEHKPVAGARVCWLREADGGLRGTALEPATTDASGRFEFVAVGARRGRVAVEAEHFVPAFADVEAGDKDVTAQVELERGVAVKFSASDPNGNSVRAVLRITRPDGSLVRDDWDLRFTRFNRAWPLTLTLAPGPYRYHVDFAQRADADGEFVATDGAEVVVAPHGH